MSAALESARRVLVALEGIPLTVLAAPDGVYLGRKMDPLLQYQKAALRKCWSRYFKDVLQQELTFPSIKAKFWHAYKVSRTTMKHCLCLASA